jgi:hypothetical protein
MAEKFTEAGQFGKDIRSKLGSAVKAAGSGAKWGYNYINDFVTEYGQEPLLNLYPQAVNILAAGSEVAAGMANKPFNAGRFPYYDLKTQFDKREEQKQVAAPVETQEEIPTITVSKKAAQPKPDLYRVMLKGGDSRKDTFFATEDAAKSALEEERARRKAERDYMVQTLGEAETLKRLGKEEKDIGAIAGVRFPAKTKEEKSALELQYMKKSLSGGKTPKAKETEEEAIKRRVREVNPQATPAQQQNYYNTLTASRARGRERGGYAEEYQAAVAQRKTPSPYEERRMQEEARNRKMSDFITRSAARDAAREKEQSFQREYNYLKGIERSARKSGQFGIALDAKRQLDDLSGSLGSNARNVTARRKLFETEAMESAKRNIEARDRLRREKLIKSTTSNPEASSPSRIYI